MEEKMKICISKDFSETPGARKRSDGEFSGEEFREDLLIPKFEEARRDQKKLVIDLDGGYGNPVSFTEEAFGGLARKFGTQAVAEVLEFISDDEKSLVNEIWDYINHPYDNTVYKHFIEREETRNGKG